MSRSPDARTVNRSEYFTPDGERRILRDVSSDRRSGQVREIVVPACSYRMGQMKMAFGLLSINPEDRIVVYDNLWLAERFPVLFVYAVSASISAVLCMCSRSRDKRGRRARIRKSSAEKRLV